MEHDSEAIRKCLAGDINAFRSLVERYEREALAHARTIVGNVEDSRELVQEAFLRAFRALIKFDSSREFYPWFYVILRNRCYGWLKSRGRSVTLSVESRHSVIVTCEADVGKDDIEETLLRLGAEDREIILLKYRDGLTYCSVAGRLEIPIGTVMSRPYYARRRLRAILESAESPVAAELPVPQRTTKEDIRNGGIRTTGESRDLDRVKAVVERLQTLLDVGNAELQARLKELTPRQE